MDGLKLNQWREDFNKEAQHLQTEYNAFFLSQSVEDCYELEVDDERQELTLQIKNAENLPNEIKDRLVKILEQTKPEDSV